MFSFKTPEKLEKWSQALQFTGKTLNHNSRVCELHFLKTDICKTYEHTVNNQIIVIERGRPKLSSTAIPCQNLPNQNEVS